MNGRSTRYRTRYRVGTLRGRPVYWHPAEAGFTVEMDGECLVPVSAREIELVQFVAPYSRDDGLGTLIDDAAENPLLWDAMPRSLRAHVDSYVDPK